MKLTLTKDRTLDNTYVERLWRSLKYEDIYIKQYESVRELKEGISYYFKFYNTERFHQSLYYRTPDEMYESFQTVGLADTLKYLKKCVDKKAQHTYQGHIF